MEILLVPHPLLRQKANKLKSISKEDIKIANNMKEAMIKAPGVGLAANQVGVLKQIVTINFEDKENNKKANYILFNPSIIEYSEKTVVMEEGCLSIPETLIPMDRATCVTVRAVNEKGQPIEIKEEGFVARIIQHEIDHLNGILITDNAPFDLNNLPPIEPIL